MWSNPFGSFKCKWTQYERVTNYDISMRQKNVGARLFQEKISAKLYIRRSEWKQMQRIWVVIYINLNANKKTIYPNKIRYTSFPIGMNSTQNSLVEICWRSMHTEIGFIGLHYTCDYIMQVTMLYDSMYKGGTNLILESCMLRKYQSMRGMNSHLRSSTHDWNRIIEFCFYLLIMTITKGVNAQMWVFLTIIQRRMWCVNTLRIHLPYKGWVSLKLWIILASFFHKHGVVRVLLIQPKKKIF